MPETVGYSILSIKSISLEQRTFSGVASTPRPDSAGDIVEPLGVQFENPSPLLLFHDATQPVGHVIFHQATKDGLTFTASIPKIDEPGRLQDRTDEVWQMVKARLLRAVSVRLHGTVEGVKRLSTGGLHWLKSRVSELSLVTIPANVECTIHNIKSHDHGRPAGASADPPFSPSEAGASAVQPAHAAGRKYPMNVSDRITALQASRKTVAESMKSLYQPFIDGEAEIGADQRTDFDSLKMQLEDHDRKLTDLLAIERAEIAPKALPMAAPSSFQQASESRQAPLASFSSRPNRPPEMELVRYAICKAAAFVLGGSPLDYARARYPDEARIIQTLKAAVLGGTTTDVSWAAPLASAPTTATQAFLEWLRPQTIIGQFGTNGIPSLSAVPFNTRIQSQTSGGSSQWVGQGKLKPVTSFEYDAIVLGFAKIAGIAVLADELVRFSSPSAEARVRDSLAATVKARMDIDFIDPAKALVANVSPASITNGIPATAHSGTDADAVHDAVTALMAGFLGANMSLGDLVWIMPEATALQLSMMRTSVGVTEFPNLSARGGTFMNIPVITSGYANIGGSPVRNIVVLVAAKEIFLADDGVVSLEATNQASIEMSDNPEGESGTIVSMWQTNQLGLKAERYINWARGRDEAVAWLDNVAWAASLSR